jgi:S-adenosylmethionine/arginine decarboxylase-like enzyme
VHTWDATGRIEIDIYTCKNFDKEVALKKVLELCEEAEYLEIDRTNGLKLV